MNHSNKCPSCSLEWTGDLSSTPDRFAHCPSCGVQIDTLPETQMGLIASFKLFWRWIYELLTHPAEFFRKMPLSTPIVWPVVFAIGVQWISSALSFTWQGAVSGSISEWIKPLLQVGEGLIEVDHPGRYAQVTHWGNEFFYWAMGMGSVMISPLWSLFTLLAMSFLIFVGTRLLVTPGKSGAPSTIDYDLTLRIVCFGLTPMILNWIPFVGWLLSGLGVYWVTSTGIRVRYGVSPLRASVLALFPQVLLLGFFLVVGLALLLLGIKFFSSFFEFM